MRPPRSLPLLSAHRRRRLAQRRGKDRRDRRHDQHRIREGQPVQAGPGED